MPTAKSIRQQSFAQSEQTRTGYTLHGGDEHEGGERLGKHLRFERGRRKKEEGKRDRSGGRSASS